MGDSFQIVVDQDVTCADAEQLSQKVLQWLAERGVVKTKPVDCVLGLDKLGYPPGPNYWEVIEDLGYEDLLLSLRTNGLQIDIGRKVYCPGAWDYEIFCPNCGSQSEFGKAWDTAVLEWYNGEGEGILFCQECKRSKSVTEWIHNPPWGYGNLGFTFWNWPVLREDFVEELRAQFQHRTVFLAGKL